jgi:hypothetical protein
MTIPRQIWTFWHSEEARPKIVWMCMRSWKRWNPLYTIEVLTPNTLSAYVPASLLVHACFRDSWARLADLVRLWVLSVHGGVWMDASILLGAPLESPGFLPETLDSSVDFVGFYLGSFTSETRAWFCPVIENWCFACKPQSPFAVRWREEFSSLVAFASVNDYVVTRRDRDMVDLQNIDAPEYLAMHVAAQKVLQWEPHLLTCLRLYKAEEGPFRYLVDAKWDALTGFHRLCQNPDVYLQPMAKLRGCERAVLEPLAEEGKNHEECQLCHLCQTVGRTQLKKHLVQKKASTTFNVWLWCVFLVICMVLCGFHVAQEAFFRSRTCTAKRV